MSSLIGRIQWPFILSVRRLRGAVDIAFSRRYLLLTNTGISVGLSGLGDVMQQRYEIMRDLKTEYDYERFRNLCTVGLVFGPMCHYWYIYLDRILPTRATKSVLKKIALDCFIMGPVSVVVFLAVLGWLQNKPKNDIVKDWSGKGLQILLADLVIWPPTEFIGFKFIPLRFRVFYDNAISLAFDNYYSYIMYRQDLQLKKLINDQLKQSEFDADSTLKDRAMKASSGILSSQHEENHKSIVLKEELGVCESFPVSLSRCYIGGWQVEGDSDNTLNQEKEKRKSNLTTIETAAADRNNVILPTYVGSSVSSL